MDYKLGVTICTLLEFPTHCDSCLQLMSLEVSKFLQNHWAKGREITREILSY